MPNLLTVPQFSAKHPAFPQGSMRNLIFLNETRTTRTGRKVVGNGINIAIIRIGRKLLIDEDKFFKWLEESQNKK